VLLIPHITSPIEDDGKHMSEIEILMAGTYNLGFIGLSNYDRIQNFLSWWKDRLYKYCYSAPSSGLFVDQKWVDFLPGFIDDVFILRHPGYNVAYWNLHERKLSYNHGSFSVNNHPIYFFHFSGFLFDDIDRISKYQDRYSLRDFPDLRILFEDYRDSLIQADYLNTKDWPYAFGRFDNGVKIHDVIRSLYNGLKSQGKDFGNPFITEQKESFYNWLNSSVISGNPITNLLDYIYHLRQDVRVTYPDPFGKDLIGFIEWAKNSFRNEYNFDEELIPFKDFKSDKIIRNGIASNVVGIYALKKRRFKKMIADFVWKYGLKYAKLIKKIPYLNNIADRVYYRLAHQRVAQITLSDTVTAVNRILHRSICIEKGIGCNISGYLDTESGVAEAARGIIKAIEVTNIPYVLNNIEQQFYRRNDTSYSNFSTSNPYPINIMHVNADQVPHVAKLLGNNYFEEKYNIGYWFWELSEFPDEWLPSFSFFNEIWVGSDFCLDSISKVSPIPVVKIPPSIVLSPNDNLSREHFGLERDHFVFLTLFDFLSFVERKNPMAVIDAFKIVFSLHKKVTLLIKSTNAVYNEEMFKYLNKKAEGIENIKIMDAYLNKVELHSLINLCDCYISLHRSEGLGLPIAEAMLLGKPVIATGYSGNMDFMNINNSFPVKYSLVEIKNDRGPYKKGNLWAEPDILHAAELMSYVVNKRSEVSVIANRGREDIQRLFKPEVIGNRITNRLKYILNNIIGGQDNEV